MAHMAEANDNRAKVQENNQVADAHLQVCFTKTAWNGSKHHQNAFSLAYSQECPKISTVPLQSLHTSHCLAKDTTSRNTQKRLKSFTLQAANCYIENLAISRTFPDDAAQAKPEEDNADAADNNDGLLEGRSFSIL
jgi:hypothetical protein